MARRDHQGLANDLKIKRAVEKILTLIREENLDVPFVSTNRSYVYADSGLTESDVWTIFNLEQEYAKFRLQYTQLKEQLIRVVKAVKEHSVME
jgi:transcriptional accessory protein Tex/SPT6